MKLYQNVHALLFQLTIIIPNINLSMPTFIWFRCIHSECIVKTLVYHFCNIIINDCNLKTECLVRWHSKVEIWIRCEVVVGQVKIFVSSSFEKTKVKYTCS